MTHLDVIKPSSVKHLVGDSTEEEELTLILPPPMQIVGNKLGVEGNKVIMTSYTIFFLVGYFMNYDFIIFGLYFYFEFLIIAMR